jgi:hypothetical protein
MPQTFLHTQTRKKSFEADTLFGLRQNSWCAKAHCDIDCRQVYNFSERATLRSSVHFNLGTYLSWRKMLTTMHQRGKQQGDETVGSTPLTASVPIAMTRPCRHDGRPGHAIHLLIILTHYIYCKTQYRIDSLFYCMQKSCSQSTIHGRDRLPKASVLTASYVRVHITPFRRFARSLCDASAKNTPGVSDHARRKLDCRWGS